MDLKQEKAVLRKMIRQKRDELDSVFTVSSDRQILRQILQLPEYQKAKALFCFVSTPNEIDTKNLIQDAFSQGKRVFVPRCISQGIMEIYEILGFEDLEVGAYGIQEPKLLLRKAEKQEIDFAVVPCVSCDRRRNRLGQGGGYYDRFMENRTYPAAAVCRESLMLEEVPVEPWDLPVDLVVTEQDIYK